MEDIKKLQQLFREKGILNKNNGRKFCYKQILQNDNNLMELWIVFSKNYRSEDEAWFSLSHLSEPPKCPICGNLCKFTGITKNGKNGYNTTCDKCSANKVPNKIKKFSETVKLRTKEDKQKSFEKRKKTNFEKYGDENLNLFGSNSFKENMIKKYGDAYYNNNEQTKKTTLSHYGVDCIFKDDKFCKESLEKKIKKYGNGSNYEKTKVTNLERYGVEHIGQYKKAIKKMTNSKYKKTLKFEIENNCTSVTKLIKQYGQGWRCAKIIDTFLKFNGRNFVVNSDVEKIKKYYNEGFCHTNGYFSKKEKDLLAFIKSIYHGQIIENDTNCVPNLNNRYFELDIYLPELNIAFDFDGNYYHSSKFKDMYYHQRKTLCCYKQNIKLAHILEYFWDTDKENVQNKIKDFIFNKKSFNDGFFPSFDSVNIKLSKPRKIIIGNLEYYDTGIIL